MVDCLQGVFLVMLLGLSLGMPLGLHISAFGFVASSRFVCQSSRNSQCDKLREEAVRYITAGSWNGEGLAKEEKDQDT